MTQVANDIKILTVVSSLGIGGTERAAQNFAFGYFDIGYDSRLLFTSHDGVRRQYLEKKGISVYNVIDKHSQTELEHWKPDLVHIHSHGLTTEVFSKLKKLFPSAKFIETNVFSIPSPWNNEIDISFQLSSWCLWRYKNHWRYAGENIAVAANPIICNDFIQSESEKQIKSKSVRYNHGIPENAFVLGRIGQPNIGNWSTWIIDIFESLHKSKFAPYLLLISPPHELIERASNSDYRNYIIIVETVYNDKNLKSYYSAINLFLHIANIGESFGYVNAESILSGVPVLTMATPWFGNSQIEVVHNEICGYVFHRKTTAKKIIEKFISKKVSYDMAKGADSIFIRFNYLNVCRDILDTIYHKKSQQIIHSPPMHLIRRSYDKPKLLVMLFLWLNLPALTRYASGYEPWSFLFTRILKKIFKLISRFK
jgi:glycosyltransferase involved in cell wall biosynthesis